MDAIVAILTRQSIRKYTSQPVPDDIIRGLLKAAMCAPSAGNQRPWHFVVINKRNILDEIPKFHPYSQMLKEASVEPALLMDRHLSRPHLTPEHLLRCCSECLFTRLISETGNSGNSRF